MLMKESGNVVNTVTEKLFSYVTQRNIHSFYVFKCIFLHFPSATGIILFLTAFPELVGKAQGLLYLCRTPRFLSLPSFK